jgi:hypothetical protein
MEHAMKYRAELSKTMLAPMSVGLWFCLYSYTSPMNHTETGFLFYYPLYFKFESQCSFIFGTWQWVYVLVWVMKEISNEKFNDYAYDLIVGSSMWAYISHYIFIVISANYFVRPMNLTYPTAIMSNMLITWIGIFASYLILNKIHSLYTTVREKKLALKVAEKAAKHGTD